MSVEKKVETVEVTTYTVTMTEEQFRAYEYALNVALPLTSTDSPLCDGLEELFNDSAITFISVPTRRKHMQLENLKYYLDGDN